jgi:hypothetical protein
MLTKVKNVLDITADTVADLASAEHKTGSIQLLGFHTKGDGGGGVFYWDATKAKSEHNGGTIIDPSIAGLVANWDYTQNLYFSPAVIGQGCWVREYSGAVNVKWFGAVGDGVADDTNAIQKVLDTAEGMVYLPTGQYLTTSQPVINNNVTKVFGDSPTSSTILKNYDGNSFLIDSSYCEVCKLGVLSSSSYTGGGLVPRGYGIVIKEIRIEGTSDSCILLPYHDGTNTFTSATNLVVEDSFLHTNDNSVYAIRSTGTDVSTHPTNRKFNRLQMSLSAIDFSGMNRASLSNTLLSHIKFNNDCSKISVSSCRFTNAVSSIVVYGQSHVFTNNLFGFSSGLSLTIDSSSAAVSFDSSNQVSVNGSLSSSVELNNTEGSALQSYVDTGLITGSFKWYGTTSNATVSPTDASLYYKLNNGVCSVFANFVKSPVTNIALGDYSFQLPYKALVPSVGTVRLKSSTGTEYTASIQVQGGSSTAYIYIDTLGLFTSNSFALSTGAIIDYTITYLTAFS